MCLLPSQTCRRDSVRSQRVKLSRRRTRDATRFCRRSLSRWARSSAPVKWPDPPPKKKKKQKQKIWVSHLTWPNTQQDSEWHFQRASTQPCQVGKKPGCAVGCLTTSGLTWNLEKNCSILENFLCLFWRKLTLCLFSLQFCLKLHTREIQCSTQQKFLVCLFTLCGQTMTAAFFKSAFSQKTQQHQFYGLFVCLCFSFSSAFTTGLPLLYTFCTVFKKPVECSLWPPKKLFVDPNIFEIVGISYWLPRPRSAPLFSGSRRTLQIQVRPDTQKKHKEQIHSKFSWEKAFLICMQSVLHDQSVKQEAVLNTTAVWSPLPAGNVVNSSLSSMSSLGKSGRGRGSGGGRRWGGGGGRGHFIHLAMYCTTTWCFAQKRLRTTIRQYKPAWYLSCSCVFSSMFCIQTHRKYIQWGPPPGWVPPTRCFSSASVSRGCLCCHKHKTTISLKKNAASAPCSHTHTHTRTLMNQVHSWSHVPERQWFPQVDCFSDSTWWMFGSRKYKHKHNAVRPELEKSAERVSWLIHFSEVRKHFVCSFHCLFFQ